MLNEFFYLRISIVINWNKFPLQLKLVNPSEFRVEHLVTQMKWRLEEGLGEAIYEIGVEDNGFLAGLTDDELEASLATLRKMADRLDFYYFI